MDVTALISIVAPMVIACVYIALSTLLGEPGRRDFHAIMVAGAGAAYLNGGFGGREFAFTTVVTYCAYKGLHSYKFIGVGWLLHTGWDVLHHLYGNPIVPFVPASSLGCAICDPVIAVWCFAGGPSIADISRRVGGMGAGPGRLAGGVRPQVAAQGGDAAEAEALVGG